MDVRSLGSDNPWDATAAMVGVHAATQTPTGAASLESSSAQQTHSEIRSLANEIAQLAHADLAPEEFFGGFLPRLCSAMGAKGAAVWRNDPAADASLHSSITLLSEHSLPADLILRQSNRLDISQGESAFAESAFSGVSIPVGHPFGDQEVPTPAHDKILRCVIAEGQPILVPPSSVRIEAERPHNPLSDALIIIPVRIQADIEYLLEVVQRPSGGPAAQRGYLRFVAQMADLMGEYLRRQKLKVLTDRQDRLQQIEHWLATICAAPSALAKQQLASNAILDLLSADRVILLSPPLRGQVLAMSGARSFDARSEIALTASHLLRQLLKHFEPIVDSTLEREETGRLEAVGVESMGAHPCRPIRLVATDRRNGSEAATSEPPAVVNNQINRCQTAVDDFCRAVACRQVIGLPIDPQGTHWVLIAYANDSPVPALGHPGGKGCLIEPAHRGLSIEEGADLKLVLAIGGLVASSGGLTQNWTANLLHWVLSLLGKRWALNGNPQSGKKFQQSLKRERLLLWIARIALVGLLCAVCCFPVSQQVAATAILQPIQKQMYYAPAAAVVSQVMVEEADGVQVGSPLLQLTSLELETQLEGLQIEMAKAQSEIAEKTRLLNRGENLNAVQRDQLEFNLRELDTTLRALQLQHDAAEQRVQELSIVARAEGSIATWDLKNRLLHHPVQAGELLLSTFDPNAGWRLQLSIPDYRAGLVHEAMRSAEGNAVAVRFSLASHPDQVLEAFAVNMAPQVTLLGGDAAGSTSRVIRTEALIRDVGQLPLKKDGAIARASIDCGTVPLVWLVFRDAFWAVSSRVRMLW